MSMFYKVLPSITTTRGSNWEEKIRKINETGLEQVALFPTCLNKKDREKLYKLLEKSSVKSILYVHIRKDMDLGELDYLVKNYKTQVFSTHTQREYPLIYDYLKYRDKIAIENVYCPFDENEIKNFGGICLDIAHLENDRLLDKEKFEHNIKIIEKYPILVNHISVIKKTTHVDEEGKVRYDNHYFEDFAELDYLKRYPRNYFAPIIAIELENNIKEQLKVRDYILRLFDGQ